MFSSQLPFAPQLRIVAIEEFWSVRVPLVTEHLHLRKAKMAKSSEPCTS